MAPTTRSTNPEPTKFYEDYFGRAQRLQEQLRRLGVSGVTIPEDELQAYQLAVKVADLLESDWSHITGASPELEEACMQWREYREV